MAQVRSEREGELGSLLPARLSRHLGDLTALFRRQRLRTRQTAATATN